MQNYETDTTEKKIGKKTSIENRKREKLTQNNTQCNV